MSAADPPPPPSRQAIEVAAGLVFRNRKILLTRRPLDGHLPGLWEFPGGKREPDETFPQCLRRELREELGIEVEVRELVESLTHHYPEKTVTLNFYRCLWRTREPQALACPDFRWVAPEELAQYDFPEADARLLERLRQSPDLWEDPSS